MTECVAECLANNPLAVASHWQQQYRSHFTASAYILDQLGKFIATMAFCLKKLLFYTIQCLKTLSFACAASSNWLELYTSVHFCPPGSKTFAKKIMGSHEILHNVDQMESLVEAFQEYNSACSPLKEGLVEAKRGCKVKPKCFLSIAYTCCTTDSIFIKLSTSSDSGWKQVKAKVCVC